LKARKGDSDLSPVVEGAAIYNNNFKKSLNTELVKVGGKEKADGKHAKADKKKKEKSNRDKQTARVNKTLTKYSYFKDENGVIYAWVPRTNGESGKSYRLGSKEFKQFVAYAYFSQYDKIPSREMIEQVIGIKEAQLSIEGKIPTYILANRFAFIGNGAPAILIDKSDDTGGYWRITKTGVTSETEKHPIFRKRGNQNLLTEVNLAGTVDEIKEFLKFYRVREDDKVLLMGALGTAILAETPRVILFLWGVQGAVKSSLTKALAWILDPISPVTIRLVRDHAELIQAMNGRAVVPFDNVSQITEGQSDILCRGVTGEGDTKRELYTDDGDVVRKYKRFIIINGINNVLNKFDAIDRSLPIKLEEVPPNERKPEKKVQQFLEEKIPKVRGAIYHTWSIGLNLVEKVEAEHEQDLPRMADFAIYGEAFCRACGYQNNQFFNRYLEAISEANKAGLESNLLAELLSEMVGSWSEEKKEQEFTPTELWVALLGQAESRGKDFLRLLPKDPPRLSKELTKLIVSIKDSGIVLDRPPRGKKRVWKVRKLPAIPTTDEDNHDQTAVEDRVADGDTVSKMSSFDPTVDTPQSATDGSTASSVKSEGAPPSSQSSSDKHQPKSKGIATPRQAEKAVNTARRSINSEPSKIRRIVDLDCGCRQIIEFSAESGMPCAKCDKHEGLRNVLRSHPEPFQSSV